MGSHSVTCHPTEVNLPTLLPGIHQYSFYRPTEGDIHISLRVLFTVMQDMTSLTTNWHTWVFKITQFNAVLFVCLHCLV